MSKWKCCVVIVIIITIIFVSVCRVCREQFIALHRSPILEQLSEHFSAKFVEIPKEQRSQMLENASGKRLATLLDKMRTETAKRKMLFKKIPDKGDLDLDVVHDSTYFFS